MIISYFNESTSHKIQIVELFYSFDIGSKYVFWHWQVHFRSKLTYFYVNSVSVQIPFTTNYFHWSIYSKFQNRMSWQFVCKTFASLKIFPCFRIPMCPALASSWPWTLPKMRSSTFCCWSTGHCATLPTRLAPFSGLTRSSWPRGLVDQRQGLEMVPWTPTMMTKQLFYYSSQAFLLFKRLLCI